MNATSLKGKLSYQKGQKNTFYILFHPEGLNNLLKESKNMAPFFSSKIEEIKFVKVFNEEKLKKGKEGGALKKFANLFKIETSLKDELLLNLGNELEKLEYVEYCDIVPEPAPFSTSYNQADLQNSSTPNFFEQGLQGYLRPEEQNNFGMNVLKAWEKTKGKETTIRMTEYGVLSSHENLEGANLIVDYSRLCDASNSCGHGTASVGCVIAQHKNFGIRGISSESKIVFYDTNPTATIENAEPGEVVFLGIQYALSNIEPNVQYMVPIVHYKTYWDLIRSASEAGITCLFSAGNGINNGGSGIDLRNSPHIFNDWGNSHGIMLCACISKTGMKSSFSNYNLYYTLNSWGDSVTTIGFDNLFKGDDTDNRNYTNTFSGTSSAGPLVLGALALVNSYAKEKTGEFLDPEMLFALIGLATGYQNSESHLIGFRPNVAKALSYIDDYLS